MNPLKTMFDEMATSNKLKFDKKKYKELSKFLSKYQASNGREQFFGSVLFGTVNVYFTDKDVLELFSILGFKLSDVGNSIVDIDSSCINNEYKRESDSTNLALLYTAHRFFTNNSIKLKDRIKFTSKVMEVYYTRQYAIILSDWLEFTTNDDLAKLVYERLSNKFILRQLGSWSAVMVYRGRQFTMSTPRLPCLKDFSCNGVKDAISAARSDVASTIKRVYKVLMSLYTAGVNIRNTSISIATSEGEMIADIEDRGARHITQIKRLALGGELFNKNALIIAAELVNTANARVVTKIIDKVTDPKLRRDKKAYDKLEALLVDTVLFGDDYLRGKEISLEKEGVMNVLNTLRKMLVSSTNNAKFQELRSGYNELLEEQKINLSSRQRNVTIAAIELYFYIMAITK